MRKIELVCKKCSKKFFTPLKRYNYLIKKYNNKNFYCSRNCFVDYIKNKPIKKICLFCNKEFDSTSSKNTKKCCSYICSSKYSQSFVNINKISKSMKEFWKNKNFKYKVKFCRGCGIKLNPKKYTKCCSNKCSKKIMSLSGRKSVELQKENRRSKN